MSALYDVTIEKVDGPEVVFRVKTIHPDAGPPPTEATFPMNLLCDLWASYEEGYAAPRKGSGRSTEDLRALARREPWGPVFRKLRTLSMGEKRSVDRAVIEELQRAMHASEEPLFEGRRVAAWGRSEHEAYVQFPGDPEAFREAITPLVAECTVDEEQNDEAYGRWPEQAEPGENDDGAFDWDASRRAYDAALPRARIRLVLRDPGLLGFVEAGTTFDTASYS